MERGLTENKIYSASNQLLAINILISREISVVILDAEYNGIEMLRRIREDRRFKELTVMMMSGTRERSVVETVFSLGVQDYVTKPCMPEELIKRVGKMLKQEEPERAETRKSGFKIVLIDDDIFDLRQERETLKQRLPCEIVTAQSAAEGMRLLEQNGADIVIVSLEMPFVNGLKFIGLMESNAKLRKIPVIIMTQTRDFAVISEINKSKASGHIHKPNITEEGLALIEETLRKR